MMARGDAEIRQGALIAAAEDTAHLIQEKSFNGV